MIIDIKKHDRVCFLGDSITAHGIWENEVIEYFINNYRELEIEFYNCGISGTSIRNLFVKDRIYNDFLSFFPTHAVVMFGINDMGLFLYDPNNQNELNESKKEIRISEYKEKLEDVIQLCFKRDIMPILCTPTPYDDYNKGPNPIWDFDIAMEKCANIVKDLANKYSLLCIDMRKIIVDNLKMKPLNEDRIHPNSFGYHLLSEQFLVSVGAKDIYELNKIVEISSANAKRFEYEDILRDIMFVEYDYMGFQFEKSHTIAYRKRLLKKKIENETRDFSKVYSNYIKYADIKDEILALLIKYTISLYE